MKQKLLVSLMIISAALGCNRLSDNISESTLAAEQLEPSSKRMVAIGDLHGDLAVTMKALRLAGAIDASGKWIGGNLIVVQTGDEVDRGDDDRQIINFFEKLRVEAKAAGGEVFVLLGNHEAMNVSGDFRYVTEGSFKDFSENEPWVGDPIPGFSPEQQARAAAFLPGGRYAKILATRSIALVVGGNVFVHGGLSRDHVEAGIESMNQEAAAWMLGQSPRPAFVKDSKKGPLWMRDYSKGTPNQETCAKLKDTLAALGVKRMVVGHSIQSQGISAACEEKVWRIDIGLSARYKSKLVQVLEITGDKVRVLSEPR